ncbi:hypothetical protein K6W26_22950 [Burkholderia sp. AU42008]|uniref:hypothetical protein n=1 Tax=unclassified Burkholderia TaxID=2613784 RepID=UPI0015C617D0|nr:MULTISPECIES: hypothetical protein [unclassified Burkholderia]MBR8234642.1 hypothetical protein [Burkholderia sp. AU32357]MBY4875915.1 hypothetical protein [Burkholderia sp. AU42008]
MELQFGTVRVTAETAQRWHDKRMADAETARQRGMFEIEAEWRAEAVQIAEHFSLATA